MGRHRNGRPGNKALVEALARRPFEAVKAFIVYTGMDPRPNDSGRKKGIRRLTDHGEACSRAALLMGAMAACKVAQWRAIYEHNRRKGLPSTAAFIVVARKLARVAFCLFKMGRTTIPNESDASHPLDPALSPTSPYRVELLGAPMGKIAFSIPLRHPLDPTTGAW